MVPAPSRRVMLAILFAVLMAGSVVATPADAATPAGSTGIVLTASNAPSGNRVVIWRRADDGRLSRAGKVRTGGKGTGGGWVTRAV